MTELIDRQEVIKNIEDCLDNYGYVDTTKFAKCMRKILNMPYETEAEIYEKLIEKTRKFIEWCKMKGYSCYDWEMLLEQYKEENS